MIVSFIENASLGAEDPAIALEWAKWISSADLRLQTVERLLNARAGSPAGLSDEQGL